MPLVWTSKASKSKPKTRSVLLDLIHHVQRFAPVSVLARREFNPESLSTRFSASRPENTFGVAAQIHRVHVGIWYILRAQRGSHTPTVRPKYTPYSYMDPLGNNPTTSPTLQAAPRSLNPARMVIDQSRCSEARHLGFYHHYGDLVQLNDKKQLGAERQQHGITA